MGILVSCIGQVTVSSLLAVISSENEISNLKQQFGKGLPGVPMYTVHLSVSKNYLCTLSYMYLGDNYLHHYHHNLQGFLQVDEIVHCLVQNKLLAQLPL